MREALAYLAPDFRSDLEPWIALVMILLFIAGLVATWRARVALKTYEKDASGRIVDSTPALQMTDFETEMKSPWEVFVDALPGVFVLFGLLVTFIGLGLAIHQGAEGAATTASAAEASEKLNDALLLVGVKFKTSVWGILGNLIFRALVSRVLHRARRDTLRTLWKSSVEKTQSRNQELMSKFDEMVGYMRSFSAVANGLERASGDLTRASKEAWNALNQATQNLERTTNQLGRDLDATVKGIKENMGSAVGDLQKAAEGLRTAVDRIKTTLSSSLDAMEKGIRKGLEEAGSKIAAESSNLTSATHNMERTLSTALGDMSKKIGDGLDKAGQKIADATGRIEQATKDSSAALTKATGGLQKELSGGLDALRVEISPIVAYSQKLAGLTSNLDKTIARLQNQLEKLNGWNERLASIVTRRVLHDRDELSAGDSSVGT